MANPIFTVYRYFLKDPFQIKKKNSLLLINKLTNLGLIAADYQPRQVNKESQFTSSKNAKN